jgi:hypothetical protein
VTPKQRRRRRRSSPRACWKRTTPRAPYRAGAFANVVTKTAGSSVWSAGNAPRIARSRTRAAQRSPAMTTANARPAPSSVIRRARVRATRRSTFSAASSATVRKGSPVRSNAAVTPARRTLTRSAAFRWTRRTAPDGRVGPVPSAATPEAAAWVGVPPASASRDRAPLTTPRESSDADARRVLLPERSRVETSATRAKSANTAPRNERAERPEMNAPSTGNTNEDLPRFVRHERRRCHLLPCPPCVLVSR